MNCSVEVFLAKIFDKVFKIQTFFIKNGTKYAFSDHFVKVSQVLQPRNPNTDFLISKRALVIISRRMEVFWNYYFAVFCRFNSIIMQNAFFFNIWRIPLNNWSNSQITRTLRRLAGREKKSGRGLITSWTHRIRDFLVLFWCCLFSKFFAFVFLMLINDKIFSSRLY